MAAKQTVSFRLPEILTLWLQEAAERQNVSKTDIVFDALWNAMIIFYMRELGKEEEIPALLKDLEALRNGA